MIKLFNYFIKDQKIKNLSSFDADTLSIKFNKWITALGNSRNKRIVNEATKFQIRKWIMNGKVQAFSN